MYLPLLRVLLQKKAHKYLYPHPQGLLIAKGAEKVVANHILGETYPHDPQRMENVLSWIEEEAPYLANSKGRRGLLLRPPEEVQPFVGKVFDERPDFSLSKNLAVSSFIESLLARYEHEEEVRVCRTSLVISEDYYQKALDRYKPYLQKRFGYGKAKARRLRDKIAALFEDNLYYLDTDQFCMKGHLLRLRSHYDGLDLFTQVKGDLMECENHFLWQDPDLPSIPHYHASRINNSWRGFVSLGDTEYQLTKHVLEQWEKRFEEVYGRTTNSRKHALTSLAETLQKTEVVERSGKKRVKAFLKHHTEATYLAADGWVFVMVDDNTLATCYFVGDLENRGFYRAHVET